MTTNSPNPVDGDVQALIADCQADIEDLKRSIDRCDAIGTSDYLYQLQSKLKRQYAALASLTAEPALWSYWFNDKTHYQEAKFGRPQIKNGKYVRETYYTTPPAQLLRPVELPCGFSPAIGDIFDRQAPVMHRDKKDGEWLHKATVAELLRSLGHEVKS